MAVADGGGEIDFGDTFDENDGELELGVDKIGGNFILELLDDKSCKSTFDFFVPHAVWPEDLSNSL